MHNDIKKFISESRELLGLYETDMLSTDDVAEVLKGYEGMLIQDHAARHFSVAVNGDGISVIAYDPAGPEDARAGSFVVLDRKDLIGKSLVIYGDREWNEGDIGINRKARDGTAYRHVVMREDNVDESISFVSENGMSLTKVVVPQRDAYNCGLFSAYFIMVNRNRHQSK